MQSVKKLLSDLAVSGIGNSVSVSGIIGFRAIQALQCILYLPIYFASAKERAFGTVGPRAEEGLALNCP